jgi:hypothetical protein
MIAAKIFRQSVAVACWSAARIGELLSDRAPNIGCAPPSTQSAILKHTKLRLRTECDASTCTGARTKIHIARPQSP